ncbi:hypothetical protein BJ684DRAFT_11614 [Piptocephalis cylindrospora]|uniref:Uncharacterized protein n=1 Tax=Piptocephalis cylindrospora TaxID=1907219 RepID=A0A4P9Y0T2_9FUNG|nr:hypothetical protein BJ684DRAFT_11614 [Piptocephalis cylindrospora]|eukprot:RKP12347.1 hypothetical protein BJ684DRAFT_11614 [Piptocephalis cylindrospora]
MSKYSSLPDIDTAPDVFETDDTPEVTNEPYFEPQLESNEIERSTLSPGEAAQRFQKATAIDPSEEGANRKRSLYRQYLRLQAGTSEYAYASRDLELEETSAQRLSRLMLEVQELDDQVKEVILPLVFT